MYISFFDMFTPWNLPFPRPPPNVVHITKLPSFTKPAKATRNARPPWVVRGKQENCGIKPINHGHFVGSRILFASNFLRFYEDSGHPFCCPPLSRVAFPVRISSGAACLNFKKAASADGRSWNGPTWGPLQFWERRLVIHKKLCYFLAWVFWSEKRWTWHTEKEFEAHLECFFGAILSW